MVAQTQKQVITPKHKQSFAVHRLTDEQAADIRKDWATGRVSQKQLAFEHGVSQSCISSIINKKRHAPKLTYKREMSLVDGQEHTYIYGETGEQLGILDTENMSKLERRNELLKEQRELEKRIRAIQNEIAALDGIPY